MGGFLHIPLLEDIGTKGIELMIPITDTVTDNGQLGEEVERGGYHFGGTSTKSAGGYTFIVSAYYPTGNAPAATERLIAVVMPGIIKSIGKRSTRALPSSCKCHAALGAERR